MGREDTTRRPCQRGSPGPLTAARKALRGHSGAPQRRLSNKPKKKKAGRTRPLITISANTPEGCSHAAPRGLTGALSPTRAAETRLKRGWRRGFPPRLFPPFWKLLWPLGCGGGRSRAGRAEVLQGSWLLGLLPSGQWVSSYR